MLVYTQCIRKTNCRRSPCGERGLKLALGVILVLLGASLPVRGAWIEICLLLLLPQAAPLSLPVRGAWIEIIFEGVEFPANLVAPRAGSVD